MVFAGLVRSMAALSALALALPVLAEEEEEVEEKLSRIEKLEEQLKTVAEELDTLRKTVAVPEDKELKSINGFGPAASKVYQKERGLSLGGYGEIRLRSDVGKDALVDNSVYDALRAVLYVGYKFNERIILNSEFEFEHAGSGAGGSVSTEFLSLDFNLIEPVNLRGGLLLIPMGFLNEIHEPPYYIGAERPEAERLIIPSTWRENGLGIFGDLGQNFSYRMYAVNGMDATGFGSDGLRGGRQKGGRAMANHWAFVGRVDYELPFLTGSTLGGSLYTGKSGQKQEVNGADVPDTLTTIWEVHADYKAKGLSLRGLFTQAFLHDTAELSGIVGETVANRMIGGYAEIAYDVLPLILPDTKMSLEPYFRFEHVDTQNKVSSGLVADKVNEFNLFVIGAQFKPHPQVVVKLDYRDFDTKTGSRPDEVQFSLGYAF